MDMRIAGSGTIPAGEYDKVSISGSGRLYGKVRCVSFSASGSSKGEDIECAEMFKISGSSAFAGEIRAKRICVSGSLKVGAGKMDKAEQKSRESGIKGEELSVSGSLKVEGDVEAVNAKIVGGLHCDAVIKAENLVLQADKVMNVGGVIGKKVFAKRKKISIFHKRRVMVSNAIEGDELHLEYVTCPRVTGRAVYIGKGCTIDLVQYTEKIEAHKKTKVGKAEKI